MACRAGLRALANGAVSRSVWAQAALVWLLLALVLVPTLGRLHQVLHAPALQVHALAPLDTLATLADASASASASASNAASPHGVPATRPLAAPANGAPLHHRHPAHAHGLLSLLLAHHAPVDCLLLDQLALGDALHSAPPALSAPVPAQAPRVQLVARAVARHVALFQARAPPALG